MVQALDCDKETCSLQTLSILVLPGIALPNRINLCGDTRSDLGLVLVMFIGVGAEVGVGAELAGADDTVIMEDALVSTCVISIVSIVSADSAGTAGTVGTSIIYTALIRLSSSSAAFATI